MQCFSEYFCNWTKEYYKQATIGKEGDFYTAVCASRFFGGAIANYIINTLESGTLKLPLNIIDVGANNINLISDVYHFLDALSVGIIDKCVFIAIDSASSALQDEARQNNIRFHNSLDSLVLENDTIFIANELFDALPCELYDKTNGAPKMAFVENNHIVFAPALDNIISFAKTHNIVKGEIPLSYFHFTNTLKRINPHNEKWLFLAFDYGNETINSNFSMRIYHEHRVNNLFENEIMSNLANLVGKCDITYNVPFSILNNAFESINARQILYKHQYLALVEDFGILDLLQKFYNDTSIADSLYIRESNKVKTLLHMLNDLFKTSIYSNF